MRQWILSFPYPLRFLFASRPEVMSRVLGIVYRVIATHLIRKAGFTRTSAHTGAVTQIQRSGSALNLNVHFHRLFLGGVYDECPNGRAASRWHAASQRFKRVFDSDIQTCEGCGGSLRILLRWHADHRGH